MIFCDWMNVSPTELVPGTAIALVVVAVTGDGNDWAAYMGPGDSDPEYIARHGDKLLREAAEALFPQYRRIGRHYRD